MDVVWKSWTRMAIRMTEVFPSISGKRGHTSNRISFVNEYFKGTVNSFVDITAPTCADFYNLCRDIIISPSYYLRSTTFFTIQLSTSLCIKLFEIIARVLSCTRYFLVLYKENWLYLYTRIIAVLFAIDVSEFSKLSIKQFHRRMIFLEKWSTTLFSRVWKVYSYLQRPCLPWTSPIMGCQNRWTRLC